MRSMATGARHHRADGWWADGWAALCAGGSDFAYSRHPGSHHFSQDVRSFSSIEKMAPASILMLRTRQDRPVVSFKLAS
jgi:hypothetical protein